MVVVLALGLVASPRGGGSGAGCPVTRNPVVTMSSLADETDDDEGCESISTHESMALRSMVRRAAGCCCWWSCCCWRGHEPGRASK
jgi:hypothetical protein